MSAKTIESITQQIEVQKAKGERLVDKASKIAAAIEANNAAVESLNASLKELESKEV